MHKKFIVITLISLLLLSFVSLVFVNANGSKDGSDYVLDDNSFNAKFVQSNKYTNMENNSVANSFAEITSDFEYLLTDGDYDVYVNLSDLFARIYKKSYTKSNWFYPVFNELPVLNFNKVENYYKYCRVMDKTFNVPEMDQQLKYYIDLNNSKKKKVRTIHWKPISQKQQLINNDVFTNGIVLLKHNGGFDFKILAPKHLGQFFRDVEHKENT